VFDVGQPVICVNMSGPPHKGPFAKIIPKVGVRYHVREVGRRWSVDWIRLAEIVNVAGIVIDDGFPGGWERWEPAFLASRFRPIVARKTSIAVFESALMPKKELLKC
jgi:hypothetical protein